MENYLNKAGVFDFNDIPGAESWVRISEITEGDSGDRKFYVKNNENERFFLRIADTNLYDRKKNEFEHLQAANAMGAAVPKPVGFGLCGNGKSLYLQTRWIYGRQGAAGLKDLHPFKQYELGMEAGLNLKLIHHCAISRKLPSEWERIQMNRCRQTLDAYQNCRSKIAYEQKIISLIEDNLHLLANRPQKLLHGGFHTENIILSYEDNLSLIDFDRWQYGDPIFDLANVLTRIRHVSQPYATGILDCYFAFGIKDQDLRLMNLYAAVDLIEQVVAARTGPADKTRLILDQIQLFMRELQGCRNICPSWYKRSKSSGKNDVDL